MAYKGYEFVNTAGTRAAFFAALKAFLIAVGWELHDAVSATVEVYKSNGESGEEPYGYIWIDAGTSTYIQFQAYHYWNAVAHTGSRPQYAFAASNSQITSTYCASNTLTCVFAGDKNMVVIAVQPTSAQGVCFGHIPARFDPTLAFAMGTAGTTGTLLVSSTDKMGVGKTIQICGATTEGCDKLVISAVPNATNIVVTELPRNYGTGSKIGAPASTFGIIALTSNYHARHYPVCPWIDAGTSVTTTAFHSYAVIGSPALPSVLVFHPQKYYSAPIFLADVSASTPGAYLGVLYENFLGFATVTGNDCFIANSDESISVAGTATGGTGTTLQDTAKSWADDSQIGKFIIITGGRGIGQLRKITDNTGTELTVGTSWATNPDATSEYKIADYVYRLWKNIFTTNCGVLVTNTEIPA